MVNATARPDVLTRARELRAKQYTFAAIAEVLQGERYPTERGAAWAAGQVCGMLKSQSTHAASLAPCELCGDMTVSKCGICTRRPECKRAYLRKTWESKKPEDTSKPCASCGRPTKSTHEVCARPSCLNEYARARTAVASGAPSVYAVWLPVPSILKVGFSKHTSGSRIACATRDRARNRGWDATGSWCIWQKPGDTRTEAWMQATLSFRWRPPFHAGDGRLCEWFTVYHLTVEEVTEVLDSTYRLVPPDLTRPAFERQSAGF
jgi:hypothetical protein